MITSMQYLTKIIRKQIAFDGEPSNGMPPPKKYIFEKC